MKAKYLLLMMFLLSCIAANSYSQLVFLNRYSGNGGGTNTNTAITTDSIGNTYVTGYTTGLLSGHDITTLKYDPSGRLIWSATYNGTGNSTDEAYAITLDNLGNVFVAGTTTSLTSGQDMIIISYDNNGNQLWARTYTSQGNYTDVAYAITVDAANNPIISGYSYANGGNQLTVIKYDPSGAQLFAQVGGISAGTSVVYAITVDGTNNIIATGMSILGGDASSGKQMTTVKYDANGTQQWIQNFNLGTGDAESYGVVSDASGNVYITGYASTSSHGKDYVTIKYNPAGTQQWMNQYNNSSANSDDIPRKIILDDAENVVITGSSKHSQQLNTEDYLAIMYNGSGNQQWQYRYTDPVANNTSISYGVTQYKHSRFYITGSSRQSTSAGSEDIVTIELKKNGSFKTKYRISNPGSDCAYDIRADSSGNFMLAGFLASNSNGMASSEINSMVCAKYDGSGSSSSAGELVSLADLETGIPNNFNLYQNYPNPFNPSTNIKFDVGQSSIVKIALYDILGREVLVPVNEYMNAGTYEISISLNNLSSGLYFYKMTSGSFTNIKKMILTK